MSYANGTTHYNLPQTVGTDKRDWADPNQAFADIDAAIYGAVQDTAQAALDIDALEGRMDTAEQGISTNAGNIAGLDTRLTTAEGAITSQGAQITDTRQDLEDMICAYNEASATSTHAYAIGEYFIYNDVLYKATQTIAIGDTIVPDTNCATTNVTTEILAIEDLSGDVSQLQTDVDQLQTDVDALSPTVINSVDATSLTWNDALTSLISGITFDITKQYRIDKLSATETEHFYLQEINSSNNILFMNQGFYLGGGMHHYITNVLWYNGTLWEVLIGEKKYNYTTSTDSGFTSTTINSTVNATLKLIEIG